MDSKMIKAIIFDVGGVIMDLGDVSERYKNLCKKYDKEGNVFWMDFRDEWNKTKVDEMSCEEFYNIISERIGSTKEEIKSIILDGIKIDNEIKELILKLKKNYKIGILTNTIKDIFNENIKKWNFKEFAEVVSSYGDKVIKPDTEAINLMIKKLDVNKDEVIFVDDHLDTVQKYNDYGVKSIRFENFNQLISELKEVGIEA